jgi:hypothetical protein
MSESHRDHGRGKPKKDEYRVETAKLTLETDNQGQVQIPASHLKGPEESYTKLVTVRTPEGRFAHLGFRLPNESHWW